MSLNTFRAVMLAQLEQADIAHLAIRGALGVDIVVEMPNEQRVVLLFDLDGDLLSIETDDDDNSEED